MGMQGEWLLKYNHYCFRTNTSHLIFVTALSKSECGTYNLKYMKILLLISQSEILFVPKYRVKIDKSKLAELRATLKQYITILFNEYNLLHYSSYNKEV